MAQVRPSQTTSALPENSPAPAQECSSDDEVDVLDGVFIGPMSTDAENTRRRALLDALAQQDEHDDSSKSSEPFPQSQSGSPIDGETVGNTATDPVSGSLESPMTRPRYNLRSRVTLSPVKSSRPTVINPPRISLPALPPSSVLTLNPSRAGDSSVVPEVPPAVPNACDPPMSSSPSLLHPEHSSVTSLADASTHTALPETHPSDSSATIGSPDSHLVIERRHLVSDAHEEADVEVASSDNVAPPGIYRAENSFAEPVASTSALDTRCESENVHLSSVQPDSLEFVTARTGPIALIARTTLSVDCDMSLSRDSGLLSAEGNAASPDIGIHVPGVTIGRPSPTRLDVESTHDLPSVQCSDGVDDVIAVAITLPKGDFVTYGAPPFIDQFSNVLPLHSSGVDVTSPQLEEQRLVQEPIALDTTVPQAFRLAIGGPEPETLHQDLTASEEHALSPAPLEASISPNLEDEMITEFSHQYLTINSGSEENTAILKDRTLSVTLDETAPIPRPNPFLAVISPTNLAATPSNPMIGHSQESNSRGSFNPFLPATPDSPSSPARNASTSRPIDTSAGAMLPDPLVSSTKKRRAEPILHESHEDSAVRPRKKPRQQVTHDKLHIVTPVRSHTTKGVVSPKKRPRPSPPDALELALREIDAERAAAARKRVRRSSSLSPATSVLPTSFVRAGSSSPQRPSRQGARNVPSLDFRKIVSAKTTKSVRPDIASSRSEASTARQISSPVKSSAVNRQFPTIHRVGPTHVKHFPSSPVRPVAAVQRPPIPSSPSPASRRIINFPQGSQLTPKGVRVHSSSPFRFPALRIGAPSIPASRPTGSIVNENVFQRGPGSSPTRARFTTERGPAVTPFITQSSMTVSSPAKPVAPRAGQKPSGIPIARAAALSDSKLPRPVMIAKSSSDRKAFTFGAGNISTFAPMPTNVFTTQVHVPGVPFIGSLSKAALSLQPSSPHKSSVSVPSSSTRELRVPLTIESNNTDRTSTPPLSNNVHAPQLTPDASEPPKSDSPGPASDISPSTDPINLSPSRGPRRTSRRISSQPHVPVESDNALAAKLPPKRKAPSTKAEPRPLADMTATAVRTITTRHTRINEGHFNALDIKVVFKDEPRPPSPGSKVRTVLQREHEEAEQGRTARARKRGLVRGLDPDQEGNEDGAKPSSSYTVPPDAGRPLKHPRAPGDDDEYNTPKRIRLAVQSAAIRDDDPISTRVPLLWDVEEEVRLRKGKEKDTSSSSASSSSATPPPLAPTAKRKFVRWDKLLAGDAESLPAPSSKSSSSQPEGQPAPPKSALAKDPSSYGLDIFGNAINTEDPLDNLLTKSRVVVTKVVYKDDQDALADPVVKKALKEAKEFASTAPD